MRRDQLNYLHEIRSAELERALEHFPPVGHEPPLRVLEVGAGTGHQAHLLRSLGYQVTAIDVPESAYHNSTLYPIVMYDGSRIPAEDHAFDVVFSSNVLEHVSNLEQLLAEMNRVTSPGGVGIHLLPTPVWRIWTTATHYIWLLKSLGRLILARGGFPDGSTSTITDAPRWLVLRDLVPARHGERGSLFTEAYYFSSRWWKRSFADKYDIEQIGPAGVFYTGSASLGSLLPIRVRRLIALVLGSSCSIYVVRPRSENG